MGGRDCLSYVTVAWSNLPVTWVLGTKNTRLSHSILGCVGTENLWKQRLKSLLANRGGAALKETAHLQALLGSTLQGELKILPLL